MFSRDRQGESDEEYVERIRDANRKLQGWRPWLLAFNIGVVVAYVVIFQQLHQQLNWMQGLIPGQNLGNEVVIIFGLVGLGFGVHIGHIIHGVGEIIWGNRTNELLVKYFDLVRQNHSAFKATETEHS